MDYSSNFLGCDHEPWCSKPEKYCRYMETMEILDNKGRVVETNEPGTNDKEAATITCIECGKKAWYESTSVSHLILI